jgi:serine/threonine-protein kinase
MSGEEIAGRYRLIEPLGRGATSSVWLAEDTELERRVAVKLLSPAADRARFEREARSAAALSHPNLCALYDYGESEGKPFMVLEYLPNGSLEERLAGGSPLADADVARVAAEIAAGLAHAHGRGLVHRDLKPANVLFDSEGRAKIADFGIARMGADGTLTEAGTVLGTASYISPEQAGGKPAGPASDVYSFGVILFRMLTGRLPFVAANAMEVVRMHRDDRPPAVSDFRTDAPAGLELLTAAALAKDPAQRPRDGSAVLAALRGGDTAATIVAARGVVAADNAATSTAAATQVIRPRPRGTGAGRRTAFVAAALVMLALLGGGLALALVLTGGSSGGGKGTTLPGLSLPTVSTVPGSTATTAPATSTTGPTTTQATTTQAATTAATTTPATATRSTTTAPVTLPTIPPTTAVLPPTTTAAPPPTTTAPTTTPATTDTTATTTTVPAPTSPGATTTNGSS